GETWDCAKDAVVTVKTTKGTFGFIGECKRITIAGSKNAISIANVAKLSVGGSANLVNVDQVNSIVVSGSRNTRYLEKAGPGDKPKVKAGSKTNHVAQAK